MNYEAPAGWSRHGHGCAHGCVCSQGPETALAYALPVWSAMADKVRSDGGQGETGRGLTVGVDGDRVAMQWQFEAVYVTP